MTRTRAQAGALAFEVPGCPVPKDRARIARGHGYTPKRTVDYERSVFTRALHAVSQLPGGRSSWPMDARYRVTIDVAQPDMRRRDIDNMSKSILDGLNGVAWDDDSQVDALSVERVRGTEVGSARVRVEVMAIAATRTRQDASGESGRVRGGPESGRDTGHAGGLGGACQCSADYEVGSGYRCKACKGAGR